MPERDDVEKAVQHILRVTLAESGYDFTDYQLPFVIRRLRRVADRHAMVGGLRELAARIGERPVPLVTEVLDFMSISVTELFRDPPFWAALRSVLAAKQGTRTSVRAWVAGCSSGEEAYSLAILFTELRLPSWRIYATDIDEQGLRRARNGLLEPSRRALEANNYVRAGGSRALGDYLSSDGTRMALDPSHFLFTHHNLATDGCFNSFDVILCRNVMIYFNADLHRRVHETMYTSLVPDGILGLGSRESIRSSDHASRFETLDAHNHIYRRRL